MPISAAANPRGTSSIRWTIGAILVAMAATNAQPLRAAWVTTRITQNSIPDRDSQANDTGVYWLRNFTTYQGPHIYRFDGQDTTLVTNPSETNSVSRFFLTNAEMFYDAEVSLVPNQPHSQIFARSLATGAVIQITDNTDFKSLTAASGKNVAWIQGANVQDVYFYSLDQGTPKRVAQQMRVGYPMSLSGDYFAWQGLTDRSATSSAEIFLYNDATGITKRITDDAIADSSPAVFGGRVAYRHGGADPSIFLYDDSTGATVSVANVAANPQLSASKVAWIALDTDTGTQAKVGTLFAYDIATQMTTKIPVWPAQFPTAVINDFVLDGDNLAWAGFDGHDLEVFFYDGLRRSITQITDNELDDYDISLHGLTLSWSANAVSLAKPQYDTEIYVAHFNVPEPGIMPLACAALAMLFAGARYRLQP